MKRKSAKNPNSILKLRKHQLQGKGVESGRDVTWRENPQKSKDQTDRALSVSSKVYFP